MHLTVVVKGGKDPPTLQVLRGTYQGRWLSLVDGAQPFVKSFPGVQLFTRSKLPEILQGDDVKYYQGPADTGNIRLSIFTTGTVFVIGWGNTELVSNALRVVPAATKMNIEGLEGVTMWTMGSGLAAGGRAQASLNLLCGDVNKRVSNQILHRSQLNRLTRSEQYMTIDRPPRAELRRNKEYSQLALNWWEP